MEWWMRDEIECIIIYDDKKTKDKYRTITQQDLDIILYDGDWCVVMKFDDRALPDHIFETFDKEKESLNKYVKYPEWIYSRVKCQTDVNICRVEFFNSSTTLGDFVSMVSKGYRYGFFEELKELGKGSKWKKNIPKNIREEIKHDKVFMLLWSS